MSHAKDGMAKEGGQIDSQIHGLLLQGWVSLAVWMTFGLLLEGLLGYKIPDYLQDVQRRELFRLAHSHGTILNIVLILAAISCRTFEIAMQRAANLALRIGTVLMPLGFLLAGIRHTESDPGLAIWLVPPAALLNIFGIISMALAWFNKWKSSTKDNIK